MSEDEISWKGSSLEEIFDGFEVFDDRNEAPSLENSEIHTILFQTPLPEDQNIQPFEDTTDVWDDNHVKLPCNKESIYYEIGEDETKVQRYRWDLIKSSLTAKKISNSQELEDCIKAYNTKYESTWSFKALHALFEDEFLEDETEYFFNIVLPKIIDLALSLPELIKTAIPLLKQTMSHTISMSKKQAACLLANAFLCTFPNRNQRKNSDYPEINFNRLFCNVGTSTVQKIKCICNYFRRILVKSMPTGVLTFQRRYIDPENLPKWEESDLKFSSIKWHIDSYGRIEKGHGMLQMDFANRYLGGGALGHGCVQEEIRFMINPELIVGMLFCESMKSSEAILIYGTEQFNKYSGYASSFSWEGNFEDETPCDKFRRKIVHIAAIDALSFRNPYVQFDEKLLRRDVNKAYCGFYRNPSSLESSGLPVATGNWGCGAFGGFNKLKCLVQLIACVANRRNLVYYTFGDEQLVEDMNNMFRFLSDNDVTIGQLWQYLATFKSQNKKFNEFYQYIYDQHDSENFLEELEEQADSFDVSHEVHIERGVAEGSEKRRSYEEAYVETSNTIEISIHYPEAKEDLENPSKRTRTEECADAANISDLCDKLNEKIQDNHTVNHDNLIEEDCQEIILAVDEVHQEISVPNECTEQDTESTDVDVEDCDNQDMESNLEISQSHDDHNYQGATETKEDSEKMEPPQRKTILDYFKPKTSNS